MSRLDTASLVSLLGLGSLLLLAPFAVAHASTATGSITVSPTAAVVGATITVTGAGFPPGTALSLEWASVDASWVVQGCAGCSTPTPQVTGIKTAPTRTMLGSAQSNSSGSFSARVTVPPDFGGSHFVQAFLSNGTAMPAKATFIVEPSFHVSPTSGPAGTPIEVTATGLGYGSYSTSYHLSWDNTYVGYTTAVTTHGSTNFTFYASGTPGVHFINIYQGYPGPAYLNPQQGPPASETQSTFPPYIPLFANFTITPLRVAAQPASGAVGADLTSKAGALGAFALLAAISAGGFFVARKTPEERRAISRGLAAVAVAAIVVIAGVGIYAAVSGSSGSATSSSGGSTTQTSSVPQATFVPVATVVRPPVSFPVNNATSGPRISITPDMASVGDTIAVNGQGFAPNAQLPLVWTTRAGSNVNGYKLVSKPLRNVTAAADGSFAFDMKVPADLGGLHFIAAGNLTERSNGTLFIQRSAAISTTEGPQGALIQVTMHGVGWDFNTNIVAVDYDNSYIGYACGFNSGGNVTVTIVASGSPGIHDIDIYPSIWWGPSTFLSQQVVEYRYPILTPQDQPELMPSFHFTFLMTSGGNATQAQSTGAATPIAISLGAPALSAAAAVAVISSASRVSPPSLIGRRVGRMGQ